ncbi:hypothetical protein [Acinetobacter sp. ANC 4193]
MKSLINFIFIFIFSSILTGCGVLFATGNWWNNDYAPYDEIWVHSKMNKVDSNLVMIKCSELAENSVSKVNLNQLTEREKEAIIKKFTHEQNQEYFRQQEQCYLDHGFKFYPRGVKRNHPTVCFGESKKMPGCQSVFDIPIL